MRSNAHRMEAATLFVHEQPGATMRMVIAHLLSTLQQEKPSAYKQAAMIVERIIKDRHVRQAPDLSLHPWDAKRKTYAEALERAMFAAPNPTEYALMVPLACKAWRAAGDDNRARTLELLPVKVAS